MNFPASSIIMTRLCRALRCEKTTANVSVRGCAEGHLQDRERTDAPGNAKFPHGSGQAGMREVRDPKLVRIFIRLRWRLGCPGIQFAA